MDHIIFGLSKKNTPSNTNISGEMKDEYNNNQLHWACMYQSFEIVKETINDGVNINERNNFGMTPLHCIVSPSFLNDVNIIEYLLDNGARIDIPDMNGWTPLHLACINMNENVFKVFEKYINLNAAEKKCSAGNTPLHYACMKNMTRAIDFFLNLGVNINALNLDKATPILIATMNKNINTVKKLLDAGADPNIVSIFGYNSIGCSIIINHEEIFGIVIDKIDLSQINNQDNNLDTLLHLACYRNNANINIVRKLLNKGINLNIQNNDGNTPLHIACFIGHHDIASVLIMKNADCKILNNFGVTPFVDHIWSY